MALVGPWILTINITSDCPHSTSHAATRKHADFLAGVGYEGLEEAERGTTRRTCGCLVGFMKLNEAAKR